ncbi:MAG: tRNA (adenine(22)-N(1))-methyltransferase TrmK [Ectothiorhodospiraceae bacterium]|nr:tRNA (adenine(22)-N(1))-methyltransferase TrmK [Ectothiorhodospiraceae bacterium]
MAKVDNREFLVMGNVAIPSAQSAYFLSHWEVFSGESVLDLGTGSGVQAVFAADLASLVVATDINPVAIKATVLNAKRNGVSDRIDVRQGDLFGPIKPNEKFNVILSNINYPFNKWTEGLWKLHERFFAEVGNHLKPDGRIYYQSGEFNNVSRVNDLAEKNGLKIISMRMDAVLDQDKRPIVYLLKRKIDLK